MWREKFKNKHIFGKVLIFFASLFAAFAFVEITAWLCFFSPWCVVPKFGEPTTFTHPVSDIHWALQTRRMIIKEGPEGFSSRGIFVTHPYLGWDVAKSYTDGCYITDENGSFVYGTAYNTTTPKIIFYGDSYTQGIEVCGDQTISAKTEELLERDVLNFGRMGYGFDQIYLKLEDSYEQFESPIVIVGITHHDFYRSTLRIFSMRPKPYFIENSDGELVLAGVPIEDLSSAFIERSDESLGSFSWSAFYYSSFGKKLFANKHEAFAKDLEKRTLELNEKIFQKFANLRGDKKMNMYFALYYAPGDVKQDDTVLTKFAKDMLERYDIPYFDTKIYFLEYLESPGADIADLYLSDGHFSEKGNEVIAQAISRELK